MSNATLTRDNLFQLNCLIWASFPQPVGAPVTAVLRNAGYELFRIEQPLNASVVELASFRKTPATLQIQPNPVVDVVFHNKENNAYALIECKPSSFGVDSDWSPQARGLIVAGGNLSSRIGVGGKPAGEVCYLAPMEDAQAIDDTLIELCNQVRSLGFVTCPTGPLGLSIKGDGVYIGLLNKPNGTAQISLKFVPDQKVLKIDPDQDPRPLYVIPWIPDVKDDADLESFKEKVRIYVLSQLGRASIGGQITISFEELLDEVSRGVFRHWRDRDSLLGRVFPMVGKLIAVLFRDDSRVKMSKREAKVILSTEADQVELMDKVRTAGLPQKLPEGVQLTMDERP